MKRRNRVSIHFCILLLPLSFIHCAPAQFHPLNADEIAPQEMTDEQKALATQRAIHSIGARDQAVPGDDRFDDRATKAFKVLDKLAPKDNPGFFRAHMFLARYELDRPKNNPDAKVDIELVLQHIGQCIQLDESSDTAHAMRGDALMLKNNLEEAAESYDSANRLNPKHFAKLHDVKAQLGRHTENQKLLMETQQRLEQLVDEKLHEQAANNRLAIQTTRDLFERVVSISELASTAYDMGTHLDDASPSIALLEKILDQTARDPRGSFRQKAIHHLHSLYLKQANYLADQGVDANMQLDLLEKVIRHNRSGPEIYSAIAKIAVQGGKSGDRARNIIEEYGSPSLRVSRDVHRIIIEDALKKEEYARAIRWQTSILNYDRSDSDLVIRLAETHLKSADRDLVDALKHVTDCISHHERQKSPEKEPAQPNYPLIEVRAKLLFALKRYGEAVTSFEKVLKQRPNDDELVSSIAICYDNIGKKETPEPPQPDPKLADVPNNIHRLRMPTDRKTLTLNLDEIDPDVMTVAEIDRVIREASAAIRLFKQHGGTTLKQRAAAGQQVLEKLAPRNRPGTFSANLLVASEEFKPYNSRHRDLVDLDLVIRHAQHCVTLDPNSVEAQVLLGDALLEKKGSENVEKALAAYKKAYVLDPHKFGQVFQANDILGRSIQNDKLLDDAERRLTKAVLKNEVEDFQKTAAVLYELGTYRKDSTSVIELLETMLDMKARENDVYFRHRTFEHLSSLYARQARHIAQQGADIDTQLKLLNTALHYSPYDGATDAKVAMTEIVHRGGDAAERARKLFDPETTLHPKEVRMLVAEKAYEDGDYNRTIELMRTIIKSGREQKPMILFARSSLKVDDPDLLREILHYIDNRNKEPLLEATTTDFLQVHGEVLLRLGRFGEATVAFEKVLQSKPNDNRTIEAIVACFDGLQKQADAHSQVLENDKKQP